MATIFDRRTFPYAEHTATPGLTPPEVLASFPGATRLLACGARGEITRGTFADPAEPVLEGGCYALVFGATRSLVDEASGGAAATDKRAASKRAPRIMVAVDDHRPGRWALRWALHLARRLQTRPEVTLFHAVDASLVVAWEGEDSAAVSHFTDRAGKLLRKVTSGLPEADLAGVRLRLHAVVSNPADGIVEAAMGHDLVVMGYHGRTGVKRFFLGSVCEAVLRHAVVPVFTVQYRGDESEPEDAPAPAPEIDELLVAVGPSGDFAMVASAAALAGMLGARLTFAHVLDGETPPEEWECPAAPADTAEWYASECRSRYPAVRVAPESLTVRRDGEDGKPADAIIELAAQGTYDAVIVGTRGRGFVERVAIGSVCARIARKCPVPVIVVGTGKKHPLGTSQGFVAFDSLLLPVE